ncbi:MAG: ribose-phosphate diphosphokinase, partial [Dehalococcoidia bacterium]
MDVAYNDLGIFAGRAHAALAQAICDYLERPLGECDVFEFSNENIFCRICENVRQRDIFLVQPLVSPVNTRLVELLIMIDAFKRASAGRITAVIPYYAYGRSDKKDQPRVPITARLLANLI